MESFFSAVANLGFPIAVASYLLFRFEKKIAQLDEGITGDKGLVVQIADLTKTIRSLSKEVKSIKKVK